MSLRPRTIARLDIAIALLIACAVLVWITGGYAGHPFGIRVSLRRPDRALAAAAIFGLVRWRNTRGLGCGFLGVPIDRYRRWRAMLVSSNADEDDQQGRVVSRWRPWLAAGGVCAAVAFQLRDQWRHMSWVADLGDPLFSIWRLAWVRQQLTGDPRPLFDANIFHPSTLSLTRSDAILLPGLAASPLFAAGLSPAVIYNLLMLSAFALSGVAASLLTWRLTRSASAALVAGVLYALYPYRLEHYSHLELQMTMWMPLTLWWLHRFAERWRTRDALGAALCLAAQAYSSMYYGALFVFYAAVVMGVVARAARPGWRRLVVPAGLAAVVTIALVAPLARPYVAAHAANGERPPWAVDAFSATASDYLRPHFRVATWAGRLLPDDRPERSLFPGLTPVVLSVAALIPPVGTVRLAYAAGAFVAFDLSRGMKGALYPYLYEWCPPVRGLRSPARIAIVLAISLVVLAGWGVKRVLARVQRPAWRALALAGIVAAILIDLRPALGLVPVWPEPPSIYRHVAGQPGVVLAEFPFENTTSEPIVNELPFMYFSIWHWQPMVNGYSGFQPEDHEALVEVERDFPSAPALAALRARGVTHVTANCALMPDRCDAFLARVDASPALALVSSGTWQGKPVRLYRLR